MEPAPRRRIESAGIRPGSRRPWRGIRAPAGALSHAPRSKTPGPKISPSLPLQHPPKEPHCRGLLFHFFGWLLSPHAGPSAAMSFQALSPVSPNASRPPQKRPRCESCRISTVGIAAALPVLVVGAMTLEIRAAQGRDEAAPSSLKFSREGGVGVSAPYRGSPILRR